MSWFDDKEHYQKQTSQVETLLNNNNNNNNDKKFEKVFYNN